VREIHYFSDTDFISAFTAIYRFRYLDFLERVSPASRSNVLRITVPSLYQNTVSAVICPQSLMISYVPAAVVSFSLSLSLCARARFWWLSDSVELFLLCLVARQETRDTSVARGNCQIRIWNGGGHRGNLYRKKLQDRSLFYSPAIVAYHDFY